jgi:hypothetical protein
MPRLATSSRLPRSGNAALASGALIQAVVGAEFVLAGLNKLVDPDFHLQFKGFLSASPAATSGPLAPLFQLANTPLVAELARFTELVGGAVLLLTALEVLRRRLQAPVGAEHGYEPLVALIAAAASFALGVMSLSIFVLEGARLPGINPGFAFSSPIQIELLLVPLAFGIAWMELARFFALRPLTNPRSR